MTNQKNNSTKGKTQKKTIASKKQSSKRTPDKKTPQKASAENIIRIPKNGAVIITRDKYLPNDKNGKSNNPKDVRWVTVIDSNKDAELAVVALTTQKQPNSSLLSTYKKGNHKETSFKHFVEIEDNEKTPIKIDDKKFKRNSSEYDLSPNEVKFVQNTVLHRAKQADTNREKISKLKTAVQKKGKQKKK